MERSFNCPSCSAPLDYPGGDEPLIECPFCGESVIVPEELRSRPQPIIIRPREDFHVSITTENLATPRRAATAPASRLMSCIVAMGIIVFVIGMIALPIGLTVINENKIDSENATSRAKNNATSTARYAEFTATAQARSATQAVANTTSTARYVEATATAQVRTATQSALNAVATEQVQVTATAIGNILTAQRRWGVVASDKFTNNVSGWPVGENNGNYTNAMRTVANGKYRWAMTAVQSVFSSTTPQTNKNYTTLYASVSVQLITGAKSSDFGLVARQSSSGNDCYYFAISDDGTFSFSVLAGDRWSTLIRTTQSAAIQPGAVNQLTLSAEGSHFILLINNQVVGVIDNSILKQGQVGVGVGLDRAGDEATVEFSNYEVRTP